MKTVALARTHTLALGGVESLTYRCIGGMFKNLPLENRKATVYDITNQSFQDSFNSEFLKSGPRTDIVGSQDGA